jgi:hypothetical protein
MNQLPGIEQIMDVPQGAPAGVLPALGAPAAAGIPTAVAPAAGMDARIKTFAQYYSDESKDPYN